MLAVCWLWEWNDEQDPTVTLKRLRDERGCPRGKRMCLIKYHDCFVGLTDDGKGRWEAQFIAGERRGGSGKAE